MPVAELKGETRVKANHVYVIPPRFHLDIVDGVVHTMPRPDHGRSMPIDSFFQALAADRGSRAVGVVLSGTGSDGTLGLQAIQAAGGVTFAQENGTGEMQWHAGQRHFGRRCRACAAARRDCAALVALARSSQIEAEPLHAGQPAEMGLEKIFRVLRNCRRHRLYEL